VHSRGRRDVNWTIDPNPLKRKMKNQTISSRGMYKNQKLMQRLAPLLDFRPLSACSRCRHQRRLQFEANRPYPGAAEYIVRRRHRSGPMRHPSRKKQGPIALCSPHRKSERCLMRRPVGVRHGPTMQVCMRKTSLFITYPCCVPCRHRKDMNRHR
jgi:hypothetical protein